MTERQRWLRGEVGKDILMREGGSTTTMAHEASKNTHTRKSNDKKGRKDSSKTMGGKVKYRLCERSLEKCNLGM